MAHTRFSLLVPHRAVTPLIVTWFVACGPAGAGALPGPSTTPLRATVSGQVRDENQVPLAGVRIEETQGGASVVTDADGRYALRVPADTELSLSVRGTLLADTFSPLFSVAPNRTLEGLDLTVVHLETMVTLLAADKRLLDRGVVLLRFFGGAQGCSMRDATLEVAPFSGGQSHYVPAGQTLPNDGVHAVVPDALIHAWVVGVAAGPSYSVAVQHPTCTTAAFPLERDGVTWLGRVSVAPKSVTIAWLFPSDGS